MAVDSNGDQGGAAQRTTLSVAIPGDLDAWIEREYVRRRAAGAAERLTKREIVCRALAIGLRKVAPKTAESEA